MQGLTKISAAPMRANGMNIQKAFISRMWMPFGAHSLTGSQHMSGDRFLLSSSHAAARLPTAATSNPPQIFWPRRTGEPLSLPISGKAMLSNNGVNTMIAMASPRLKKAPLSCDPPTSVFIWQACDGKALFIALYAKLNETFTTTISGIVAKPARTSSRVKYVALAFGNDLIHELFWWATTRQTQDVQPRTKATSLNHACTSPLVAVSSLRPPPCAVGTPHDASASFGKVWPVNGLVHPVSERDSEAEEGESVAIMVQAKNIGIVTQPTMHTTARTPPPFLTE
mmetsp:Transcript_13179/g.37938  ORF Transcript_13179/g.37938 Transcript_13179/m.37938 type:complete len:283 (+) Transcript_13179:404-1252(+)